MTDPNARPAFVPTGATPPPLPASVPPRAARPNGGRKPAARKAKAQGKGRKRKAKAAGARKTPQRRTAPISVDFEKAIAVLSTARRKDMAAIQAIVGHLNPLPKKSRERIMAGVAEILGG